MNYNLITIEEACKNAKDLFQSCENFKLDDNNYEDTKVRLFDNYRILLDIKHEITHKYDILPPVIDLEDSRVKHSYLMPEVYSYFEGETYDQYQVGNYIVDKSNNSYTIVEKDDDGDIRAKDKSGKIHFFPMNRNGMRNGAPIHGRLYAAWPKLGCRDRSFSYNRQDENRFIVAEKANRIPEHRGIPLPKGVTTHFVIDKQRNYTYELNSIDVYEFFSEYPQWCKMIPYFEKFKHMAQERKTPSWNTKHVSNLLNEIIYKTKQVEQKILNLSTLREKNGYRGYTPHLQKLIETTHNDFKI